MAKMSEDMKQRVIETKANSTNTSKCVTCPKHCDECDRIHEEEVRIAKEQHLRDRVSPHLNAHSLCWCCEKSVLGGCSWVDHKQPVPHWDAVKTYRKDFKSYHVFDCPEFVRG